MCEALQTALTLYSSDSLTLPPLILSLSLCLSPVFCPPSGTVHALVTVGHVEKQVLFMVLLEHNGAEKNV